jgi:uncharacterized membrane-anchored protein
VPDVTAGFWVTKVLTTGMGEATRPLGTSYADWVGVSHARSGLNWGSGIVSIGMTVLIIIAVGILAATRQGEPVERP